MKTAEETDPEELARLVPEVELARFERELELRDNHRNSEELSTMCVACEALRVLKRRIIKAGVLASSTGDGMRFVNSVRRSQTA